MATLKDQELQKYYEALFAMYATPGWALLMEDVANIAKAHDTIAGIETEAQLFFRHGQVDQANWLLSHRMTHEAAYQQLLSDQEGTPDEASSGGRAKVIDEHPGL